MCWLISWMQVHSIEPDHEPGGEHLGHAPEVGGLGIQVRHRLVGRHLVGELVAETGLKRRRWHGGERIRALRNFQVSEDRPPDRKRRASSGGRTARGRNDHERHTRSLVGTRRLQDAAAAVSSRWSPRSPVPFPAAGRRRRRRRPAGRSARQQRDGQDRAGRPGRTRTRATSRIGDDCRHLAGVLRLRRGSDGRHHLHRPSADSGQGRQPLVSDKGVADQRRRRRRRADDPDGVIAGNTATT